MERRKYLALTGLAASGALAGCGGEGDASDTPDNVSDDASNDDSSGDESPDTSGDDSAGNSNRDDTSDGDSDSDILEVREFSVPESADVGEEIEIRGLVRNNGEEIQVYTETVYIGFSDYGEPTEWEQTAVETPVKPGDAVQWSLNPVEVGRPAQMFVRLGEDGPEKVVEIPPERAPYLSKAAAVSGWEEPGDLESTAITQAPAGSVVEVAFRYWFYSENNRRDSSIQINIFNSEGTLVGTISESIARDVERNGWQQWESAFPVDTEAAPGAYTFEVIVVDEESAVDSDPADVDIELVDSQSGE